MPCSDVLHHRAKSCKWVFPESVFSFKRGVTKVRGVMKCNFFCKNQTQTIKVCSRFCQELTNHSNHSHVVFRQVIKTQIPVAAFYHTSLLSRSHDLSFCQTIEVFEQSQCNESTRCTKHNHFVCHQDCHHHRDQCHWWGNTYKHWDIGKCYAVGLLQRVRQVLTPPGNRRGNHTMLVI